jgi:hypothetical protein
MQKGAHLYSWKNISMSSRVSPRLKAMLAVAADQENRSLNNLVEMFVFAHCEQHRLSGAKAIGLTVPKGAKK